MTRRLRVAVHKFSSCDGCQLALLGLGEALLDLVTAVEFVHFAEAGIVDELADVDLALVEGSISTRSDVERIKAIRQHCQTLVAIGACATSGGIQALRNRNDADAWLRATYATLEPLDVTPEANRVGRYVPVDHELPGCPVNATRVLDLIRDVARGVPVREVREPLCMECKRQGLTCVLVTQGEPCLGPVTMAGCGALCPKLERACYGCYGNVADLPNFEALKRRFKPSGLDIATLERRKIMLHGDALELNTERHGCKATTKAEDELELGHDQSA